MLDYLKTGGVGPARTLSLDFAERFNVITGDNGLGKSFLLDLSWWVLTRTWAGSMVLPEPGVKAQIEYRIKGKTGPADPVLSVFRPEESAWPLDAKRPPMPGIVIYIRIDGGFSVWDPARNYWRKDPERPAAYNFDSDDVWYGQGPKDKPVSEGLERDWVSWQLGKSEQFEALDKVLEVLSPEGERIRAGKPRRILLGEGRDRPTLRIGSEEVPVAFASAGMRRVLALAYFLVWSWTEHRAAATLLGKKAENRFVIIFDEPETHLHPRWQRSILPSLAAAIDVLITAGSTASTLAPPSDSISWFHLDVAIAIENHIHTRSELDQANALPARNRVAHLEVEHNAARDQARNLFEDHGAAFAFHSHNVLLIFISRVRCHCVEKLPPLVAYIANHSSNRRAIHVHIENAEKDADPRLSYAAGIDSRNVRHFAVARRNNSARRVWDLALRVAENHKQKAPIKTTGIGIRPRRQPDDQARRARATHTVKIAVSNHNDDLSIIGPT